jgi:hypothetical protein
VRKKGLAPSRYCYRQPLKLVDSLCRRELTRILLTNPTLMRADVDARDDFIRTNSHTVLGRATFAASGRAPFIPSAAVS